jgi:hypothetical protein
MKNIYKWTFVICLGIFLLFVWLGFLFPNPNMFSWTTWNSVKLLYMWLPRILIPVFYLAILYIGFSKNRKLAQNIGLLLTTLFITFLLSLPIMYIFKVQASSKKILEGYHSFLQLKPMNPESMNFPHGKNAVRIFCLGGSTTEFKDSKGVGWTERLEKELREAYHSDSIFVYNCGRQWYTSLHSLINYETNIRHLKPDVIIFMHNVNDFIQNADFSYLSLGPFRQDYGHFVGPVVDIISTKNTGLLGRAWIKFRNIWYYNIPARTVFEQDTFPGLESYSRNINTLIDLAYLDSTKVILLTQPNIYSENMDEEMYKVCVTVNYEGAGKDKMWSYRTGYLGMKQYNDRIRSIAQKRKTYFIDLEKDIPKSLKYFLDEVHYTDTSFSLVSKTLAKEIIQLKIISK